MLCKVIFRIFQIGAYLAFILYALGIVFSRGVCCADDALYSDVAKNLAIGQGYATSILKYSLTEFDPEVGSGFTIIFPAALVIRIVGNTYWAPGLAMVIFWSILLALIGFLIYKRVNNDLGFLLFELVFLGLCILNFLYHFEQWYALLGEIPAGLLIILAILVYFNKNHRTNQLVAGILFSLAVNVKLAALIPAGVFLLFICLFDVELETANMSVHLKKTWKSILDKRGKLFLTARVGRKKHENVHVPIISDWNPILYVIVGLIIPFLFLEIWKISVLGFSGYMAHQQDYINFVFGQGMQANCILSVKHVVSRINYIYERFGLFTPLIFIFLLFNGYQFFRTKDIQFPLYIILLNICLCYTAYWVLFSLGWSRYYVMMVLLINFLLALPFIWGGLKAEYLILHIILLLALTASNWQKINLFVTTMHGDLYKSSENTQALVTIGKELDQSIGDNTVVTQWWATIADIVYITDIHLTITKYNDAGIIKIKKPYIIVLNTKFVLVDDLELKNLLSSCSNVQTIGQYILGKCQ